GLGTYYSIQKDFPEVYGIGAGGLPASATVSRKAHAMQFKGYLLFFEQLMADFLAQLAGIRQVLSIRGTEGMAMGPEEDDDPEDKMGWGADIDPQGGGTPGGIFSPTHGDVSDVPGLDQLLRFASSGSNGPGVTLAYPVDAHQWKELTGKGPVSCDALRRLEPYTFRSWHERDLAVAELLLSFGSMPPTAVTVVLEGGEQAVFVIADIRRDFVLLSKSIFDTAAAAKASSDAALYAGTSKDYYTLSVVTKDREVGYSFTLGQSDLGYYDYVNQLLSNPQQNIQQRTGYLLHLIERFAESYSYYTQLSAGFLSSEAIAADQVGLMQQFLTHLPMLGADRGRGYDYTRGSWDTTNISGLELRFKAYCGIADWRRHYLCHFEVVPAEQQYHLQVVLAGETVMTGPGSLHESERYTAAEALYKQMKTAANYRVVERMGRFRLAIDLPSGSAIESVADWPDRAAATAAIGEMERMWRLQPEEEDVAPDKISYRAEVINVDGQIVRTGRDTYGDEKTAFEDASKKIHDIREAKYWDIPAGMKNEPGRLERGEENEPHLYMDTKGLSMPIKHDIPKKPEHCYFIIAEEGGTFSFEGKVHYQSPTFGRSAARAFLFHLTEVKNYTVERDEKTGRYRLAIVYDNLLLATEKTWFAREEEALQKIDHIIGLLHRRLYTLRLVAAVTDWKFSFFLGSPGKASYTFYSSRSYPTAEEARQAALDFYRADTGWELTKDRKGFQLEQSGGGKNVAVCTLEMPDGQAGDATEKELQQLVVAKSTLLALEQGNQEALGSWLRADAERPKGGYVYRVVDKDRPRGWHVVEAGTAETIRAALIASGQHGYDYPEFCLGGDNVFIREDGKYHYRIRCRNDYFHRLGLPGADREWALFESIAGYPTEDAAQQAFQDAYLYILEKAMEHVNYGEKDFIAWDEKGKRLAIVYVAPEIRHALERAGRNVTDELVKAARTYPIRMKGWERRAADDAARRAAGYVPVTIATAEQQNKDPRYFFQLLNDQTGETDWTSAGVFLSAQDAHTAFDYFRLLLMVSGNYFIDYDDAACRYRVGIREVLAESVGSFPNEEAAWGSDGVQRFIGAAESAGGWHPEQQEDCHWGYFIACPNDKAVHPCWYETGQQRDATLEKLYTAAQGFPVGGWVNGAGAGFNILDPLDGHAVAVIPGGAGTDEPGLNSVLDLFDGVWAGLFYEDEQGLYVRAGQTLIRPAEAGISRDKWEEALLRYGAYFPIVRETATGGVVQYRVEIKLRGFAALPGKEFIDKDCGCPPEGPGEEPACYAAWINPMKSQPPVSAVEAWNAYQALLPLLADKGNYRSVHDEQALSYGIQLLEESEVLARSVQPYYYAKMAARALDRAKECVDAEGLNLVEHLLLRPDMGAGKEAMKEVTNAINVCTDVATGLGFQAGGDAYSFLMTVFLPAWPQRFRKVENRQLLESIIQRETPAHILPRILWLTPKDMCTIETQYKKWLYWLKTDKPCGDFHPDQLIKQLFETPFECMWETGCGQTPVKEEGDEWLSQINKLYCWEDSTCADTTTWSSGGGTPGTTNKKPFTMGGTRLKRPRLEKPIIEQKPVRQKPERKNYERPKPKAPVHGVAKGREGKRQGPDGPVVDPPQPLTFFGKALVVVEDFGKNVGELAGKVIERVGSIFRRKGPRD
ncbi:MAG TPA: hypothetical protein VNU70_12255, partial [Puia sp.]|nr:hypothetical protein [Puia sp.]